MSGDRFVVLGLAPARTAWLDFVTQWTNGGALPVEFVKTVSGEELRARLTGGRAYSAVVIDGACADLDRDLVDTARSRGCAVLIVEARMRREWEGLGADTMLPAAFDRHQLLDGLRVHARTVGTAAEVDPVEVDQRPTWIGEVVAVCGPGGTGASTVAMAVAQGLAADPRQGGSVVLVDLALRAEQAVLHDAGDVMPGLQELVESHRSRRPSVQEVHSFAFDIRTRGYHLVLGLRRPAAWATLRPRAVAAAFDGLQSSYRTVVCDTDADVEGASDGGSVDVEDRNVLARTAMSRASVVFVVGRPGVKGIHALARLVSELLAFGVEPGRIVPVVNCGPHRPRLRAEISAALAALVRTDAPVAGPVFLPERPVEASLRDGVALPRGLAEPLTGALAAVAAHSGPAPTTIERPRRVEPGTIGAFAE